MGQSGSLCPTYGHGLIAMAPTSKGKREPVRLTATLFPEDDPDLYAWFEALPKGKQRRRDLVLSRLRNGLVEADSFGSTASPSGSEPPPVQQKNADSVRLRPTTDQTIPVEDLNEIFGAPSFANA